MAALDSIREKLPEAAKDLKLNLQAIFRPEQLTSDQTWAIALTSAYFIGHKELKDAIFADAIEAGLSEAFIDDAKAAASIMGMNTVYYRFRHLMHKESYNSQPAKLRMMRLAQPKTDKTQFELLSMACAALAGCGMCLQAHEATLVQHGVSESAVNDVIRISAVLQGVAIALSIDA